MPKVRAPQATMHILIRGACFSLTSRRIVLKILVPGQTWDHRIATYLKIMPSLVWENARAYQPKISTDKFSAGSSAENVAEKKQKIELIIFQPFAVFSRFFEFRQAPRVYIYILLYNANLFSATFFLFCVGPTVFFQSPPPLKISSKISKLTIMTLIYIPLNSE